MAAFGAPPDIINQLQQIPQYFEVLADAMPAVEMFLRVQTQWNMIDGGFVGLNYQSIEFLFKIHEVTDPKTMLEDLQTMEFSALRVLNERTS